MSRSDVLPLFAAASVAPPAVAVVAPQAPPPPAPVPTVVAAAAECESGPVDAVALCAAYNRAAAAVGNPRRVALVPSPRGGDGVVAELSWPGQPCPVFWPVEVLESMAARLAPPAADVSRESRS